MNHMFGDDQDSDQAKMMREHLEDSSHKDVASEHKSTVIAGIKQQAAQAKMQQTQQEIQAKIQIKQAEISFEIEKQNNEANLKRRLMDVEFNYNMQLRGMEQSQIDMREQKKEEGKSQRIAEGNTQQSKMIEQRKRNLPAMNFESNEDSLDGFDLAEFNPR